MSKTRGADGTPDKDEEILSVSYSESDNDQTDKDRPRRKTAFSALKIHAKSCTDCERYLAMPDAEAKSLKTLIHTHLETAHRVRMRSTTKRVVIQEITTHVAPLPNNSYLLYPLEPTVTIANNNANTLAPPLPLAPYDPTMAPRDPRNPPPPPPIINNQINSNFKRPADPEPLRTDQRSKISKLFNKK